MKIPSLIHSLTVLLASLGLSRAANVSLTTSDPINTSSLNSAGKWSDSQPPNAANDYFTSTFFLRTPADGGGVTYTFAGNSLTLQPPAGQGNPMRGVLYKGGANDTIVINNLTNAAGGVYNQGGSGNVTYTATGNRWTIAGSSTILVDQGPLIIGYPLVGVDGVVLTNAGGNSATFTASLAGFAGKLFITRTNNAGGNGNSTVIFGAGSSNLGNPTSSIPDQITVSGGSTLTDNAGLTFNNSNGGITLLAIAGQTSATINAGATTIIAEPITDRTNGVSSVCTLTKAGAGTLTLSSANNNYAGGTTIAAGNLQVGVANALPVGAVTANGTLDLNTISTTIDALNGSGTVDTLAGGAPTLTIGASGGSGTFTGTLQNSGGALSVAKVGAGTQIVSGFSYSGNTVVAGGTLSLSTAAALPFTPGSLIVSNSATLAVNASGGTSLPANNVILTTNGSLSLTLNATAIGINAGGSLTLQDNATNNLNYGTVTANPTAAAINLAGGISAPGTNIVLNIAATGLKTGAFTLVKYTGAPLGSLANFVLSPPPGVAATLVNNTGNTSIDLNITAVPNQLAWNGVGGTSWDLATPNWTNLLSGGMTVFRQYTNGSVIAGDSVILDDSLTNDFVNPQPTNLVLNSTFYVFPLVVNSTLPYSVAGSGGITGVTSLTKSNTGSLTLLTSNSFTGGTFISGGGSLIITNDSGLGAGAGAVTLDNSSLQFNGPVTNSRAISLPTSSFIGTGSGTTSRLSGVITGAGGLSKTNGGTLLMVANEKFAGNFFVKGGTVIIDSGGALTNTSGSVWYSIGQDLNDSGTASLTLKGTGSLLNSFDFNVGDIDAAAGVLNMQDTATLTLQNLFIASANNAGSTATGTVNMNGGTLFQRNTAVGSFVVGGRNTVTSGGVGTLNLNSGFVSAASGVRVGDFGTGTVNQSGGAFEATNNGTGINLHRENTTTSFGTYNLNGGTLRTEKVTTSFTSANSLFYFNGGTLQAANGNLGATPFMNNISHAYIRNGAAFVDSQNFAIIISQALEHSPLGTDNAIDGGLTKLGNGTATFTGLNTFSGPVTNRAGTMILNSASTYSNTVSVNSGTLQLTTASTLQGNTIVSNGATLAILQAGTLSATLSNLTLTGAATVPGATVGFIPTNTSLPLMNCGTLTLNGTNSVSLAAVSLGTIPLIKYTGALAGSGNITNLTLPQGATGFVSNNVANSTLYAVITSTGPGLVWTGTNATALNTWNIGVTTNWLVNATPTSYHQLISPGDSVIFNDIGSGAVLLNTNAAPTSVLISNVTKTYTFSGNGTISGPSGLLKLGSGTAVVNLTNNSYLGNTVVSNGTVQLGAAAAISPTANLLVGPGGTVQLSGISQTFGELTGGGVLDNNSGNTPTITMGTGSGGTWNGTLQDHGAGGVALHKVGSGTWIVGGTNMLNDGQPFSDLSQVSSGTVILTNGSLMVVPYTQFQIAGAAGQTGTVVVAGGTLAVSNNVLAIGVSNAAANGTLIVNSGTVVHAGTAAAAFAPEPNSIDVGAQGATGTLIVNGGQVLNNQVLFLGDGTGASGIAHLNGGLLQASAVQPNGIPTASTIYFNGGTLLAATNSADFILSTAMVQSGGAIIDDGGFALSMVTQGFQEDPSSTGGGLIKKGPGTLYLEGLNLHTGTTLVSNGTLAGVGGVNSPVVVAPAGSLGAGDDLGIGSFTINNTLTIQGAASMRINKNGGSPTSDQITGVTTANYGGTLVITNTTSDATPLVAGDTFTLFNATAHSGNFAGIAGSPGAGLSYSFNPVNGVLSVVTGANNPTNITVGINGSTLTLSWPADHLGWFAQSNTLGVTTPNSWFDIPGSQNGTSLNLTVSPSQRQVFFRLRSP